MFLANRREDGDEQVEQHDVPDEQVDGEEGRRDVVVLLDVLQVFRVAVVGLADVGDAAVTGEGERGSGVRVGARGRVLHFDPGI